MTTVADFGQYTGVNGALTIDGVPFADCQYDIKWTTQDVTYSRGNKRSDGAIPGKRVVTTKIHKVFVHEDAAIVLGYSISDTPITVSAGVLKSAATFTADSVVALTGNPATASRVTITTGVAAITTPGEIIVYGTDSGDRSISEIFTIPDNSIAGTVFTGTKVFKTTTHAAIMDVVGDSGCTLKFDSIVGNSTLTFGDPKIFDLVGTLTKGAKSITITQTDCWFKNGGINWTDSGKVIEVDAEVSMHDPDLLEIDIVG
jgi:hypothetical protein